jgi:hypothetical protein
MSRILLKKLRVTQLITKFLVINQCRNFILVFHKIPPVDLVVSQLNPQLHVFL